MHLGGLVYSISTQTGPAVDKWVAFTATTAGRDKLYRLIQYFSRWLAYHAKTKSWMNQTNVDKIQNLSSALGTSRKLFRMGKFVDHARTISKSTMTITDPFIASATAGKSLGLALWLILDSLQWLNSQKIISLNDNAKIAKRAAQFWFFGLLCSLALNIYKKQQEKAKKEKADKIVLKKIKMDIIQDAIDILLPANIIGLTKLSNGAIGAAGTITSIMGLYNLWPKK